LDRTSAPIRLLLLAVAALAAWAAPAGAAQFLVGPGENWQHLAGKVNPGDEIILMPGRHRWANLPRLAGTAQRPVVIRALSTEKPAVIAAEREGLRLSGPQHVVVRDLTISGAAINGITVRPPEGHAADAPFLANLRLENLTVLETGPEGRRHGIQIVGCSGVVIVGCAIEGWGGAAIDLVRAAEVRIEGCTLKGRVGFGQRCGIHVRAGTRDVQVSDCLLADPGACGLAIGGHDDPPLWTIGLEHGGEAPAPPPRHLASRVRAKRCVIRGGASAVALMAAQDVDLRNLTIVRPRQFALTVDPGDPDPAALPSEGIVFESNLITWLAGDVQRLVQTGARFQPGGLILGGNLWWSPEPPEVRAALAAFPVEPRGAQVGDLDPQLDERERPRVAEAELFGAHSP
jgi:hypothetical protein